MRRAVILAGLALLALGCSESAEQNTYVVRVSSINKGGPLSADLIVFNKTDSTYSVPVDAVVTEFTNKVYSPSVITDPNTAWFDFQVKSYKVTWSRADGGPDLGTGFDFTGATTAIVPVNGSSEVSILLAPAGMKESSPFVDLLLTGGEIRLNADIDFVGSAAVDPTEDVHVHARLLVSFANYADKNN
jgi:hypothetical protein